MSFSSTNFFSFALVIVLVIFCATNAKARPVANWDYQQKYAMADLIAIGTPIQVDDTKEKVDLPGVSVGRLNKPSTGLPVIGVNTRFAIASIRKGKQSIKEITLHHYRLADPKDASNANSVSLVSFTPKADHFYLLFLKCEADGRYAPLDQTDPEVNSVEPVAKDQK